MGNGILGIGVSGLQAAQAGLWTTSHNISNATTPGYNRQQTVQSTNISLSSGNGFLGQGVQVSTVQRVYSEFLVGQALQVQTQSSQLSSYYNEIRQIDNLLADTTAGLTPALHNFFNAVQEVASSPTSIPSRQAMLSNAEALVSRFQAIDQRFSEMQEGVNTRITSSVETINSLAQQIATLNITIQTAEGSTNGQPANDLQDQRDTLIRNLSQLANVEVVHKNNGHYNIFVGSGQALVVGTQTMVLKTVPSTDDPQRLTVGISRGSETILLPEHQLQGGSLGGLLAFRRETLDSVQHDFNELAQGLAKSFNDQHQLGKDLQEGAGKAFFTIMNSNQAAQSIRVAISDPAEIAAADDKGEVANNGNALRLASLQTENTVQDGTASYQSAYARLVSQIGNKTRELEVTSQAQENLLAQTDQSLQSLSGVNLEEEAANLLRYQRAFQASSKVIEISNSLFDTLLRI